MNITSNISNFNFSYFINYFIGQTAYYSEYINLKNDTIKTLPLSVYRIINKLCTCYFIKYSRCPVIVIITFTKNVSIRGYRMQ